MEAECVALFEKTASIIIANYSTQNIDRLVTIYRAAKRSGRSLITDLYAATIAAATKRDAIPQRRHGMTCSRRERTRSRLIASDNGDNGDTKRLSHRRRSTQPTRE